METAAKAGRRVESERAVVSDTRREPSRRIRRSERLHSIAMHWRRRLLPGSAGVIAATNAGHHSSFIDCDAADDDVKEERKWCAQEKWRVGEKEKERGSAFQFDAAERQEEGKVTAGRWGSGGRGFGCGRLFVAGPVRTRGATWHLDHSIHLRRRFLGILHFFQRKWMFLWRDPSGYNFRAHLHLPISLRHHHSVLKMKTMKMSRRWAMTYHLKRRTVGRTH